MVEAKGRQEGWEVEVVVGCQHRGARSAPRWLQGLSCRVVERLVGDSLGGTTPHQTRHGGKS